MAAAPDRRSVRRLDSTSLSACLAKRLSRHSATRRMAERTQPMIRPPTAASGQTRLPQSAASLTFDPRPLGHALTAASAHATLDSTLRRKIGRLGADHRSPFGGQGSEEFDPLAAMRRHHRRAELTSWPRMSQRLHDETLVQMLRAGSWHPTIARLGLKWLPVLADAGLRL